MKRFMLIFPAVLLLAGCASTGGGSGTGISLYEAIEQSAEKIAGELPKGSRVAIVAFESENDNLSEFIMEEITGALVDRDIEVADRQNLAYVFKELDFQMSGDVSDETAQSIGKFLGAQLVITGQLQSLGGTYRYRTSVIHVEKATRDSVTRLTVRNDRETQDMVAALASQQTTVKTAKYGVSEDKKPQTAGTFLDRGILFASRSDYEMAIDDFTEAIKLDPELSSAYLLRGRALFASVSTIVIVGDNFSSVGVTSTGGQVTADQARAYDQAIADFTQALRLDPDNAGIYKERGLAYTEKGDTDRAIADFNQAIRMDPNDHGAYHFRGGAYYIKKEYDKAIADFDETIRLNPNNGYAYSNRGVAYAVKEDIDRAMTDFNQAIRLNPNDHSAYHNRGMAYRIKGDLDRAIADYDQSIRLNPNGHAVYSSRGNAYYDKQDYDKAIADFDQAIRLNPDNAAAFSNRGNAYLNKGEYDRAITDYNHAIRLTPNFADAYSNRGVAYIRKSDLDRAIADFEAALRINPNHPDAKRNLEIARQIRGR